MSLPRRALGTLPTPLMPAPALGEAIGLPRLWLKRDDLIGFGFGGNKVRSLEYLLGDALAQQADTLVTGAGPQSNHVRATAAAAAVLGLSAVAVYWGQRPDRIDGNYRLTRLLGAEVRFTGNPDRGFLDSALERVADDLRAGGRRPYLIPRGGGCGRGAIGHVGAARELRDQAPDAAAVVMAVGSGTTIAGWVLGSRLIGAPWRVSGYSVSRPAAEVRERALVFAREAAALLECEVELGIDDFEIDDQFIGEGYGIPTPEGLAAIERAARRQGVFFDPTYTGKALAGLSDYAAAGRHEPGERVVFLHSGGEPALFAGEAPW